jgi:hypothetical protein
MSKYIKHVNIALCQNVTNMSTQSCYVNTELCWRICYIFGKIFIGLWKETVLACIKRPLVGTVDTEATKTYCILAAEWVPFIHLQRRCIPSRHERSLLAKGETIRNFASKFVIYERTRFFYMPQSWDMEQTFYFPSEGRHAEDFFNRRLRSGANPLSWVPEASMLTTRPPKPLSLYYVIQNCTLTIRQLRKGSLWAWFKPRFSQIQGNMLNYSPYLETVWGMASTVSCNLKFGTGWCSGSHSLLARLPPEKAKIPHSRADCVYPRAWAETVQKTI